MTMLARICVGYSLLVLLVRTDPWRSLLPMARLQVTFQLDIYGSLPFHFAGQRPIGLQHLFPVVKIRIGLPQKKWTANRC